MPAPSRAVDQIIGKINKIWYTEAAAHFIQYFLEQTFPKHNKPFTEAAALNIHWVQVFPPLVRICPQKTKHLFCERKHLSIYLFALFFVERPQRGHSEYSFFFWFVELHRKIEPSRWQTSVSFCLGRLFKQMNLNLEKFKALLLRKPHCLWSCSLLLKVIRPTLWEIVVTFLTT